VENMTYEQLPKQARIIAQILVLHPDATRAKLEELVQARITTRQPISRVINYYWSLLVKLGYTTQPVAA